MTDMDDDDYLWDKSGPPDPEVVRLEELLRPLGQQELRPIPLVRPETTVRLKPGISYVRRYVPALAAAALLAIVVGGWWLGNRPRPTRPGWEVTSVEGSPTISSRRIGSQSQLPVGDWLETNEQSKATISVPN